MPRDGYREGYRDGYDNYDSRMDGRGDGPWRGRGDYQRGHPRGGRGGPHHNRIRRDSYQSGEDDYEEDQEYDRRDPYANLMSQREKEWIIKIQLMQLHTDNPYVDDYYFTVSKHTISLCCPNLCIYICIVTCKVHPALVKQVHSRSLFFNFKWSVIRLTLSRYFTYALC